MRTLRAWAALMLLACGGCAGLAPTTVLRETVGQALCGERRDEDARLLCLTGVLVVASELRADDVERGAMREAPAARAQVEDWLDRARGLADRAGTPWFETLVWDVERDLAVAAVVRGGRLAAGILLDGPDLRTARSLAGGAAKIAVMALDIGRMLDGFASGEWRREQVRAAMIGRLEANLARISRFTRVAAAGP